MIKKAGECKNCSNNATVGMVFMTLFTLSMLMNIALGISVNSLSAKIQELEHFEQENHSLLSRLSKLEKEIGGR